MLILHNFWRFSNDNIIIGKVPFERNINFIRKKGRQRFILDAFGALNYKELYIISNQNIINEEVFTRKTIADTLTVNKIKSKTLSGNNIITLDFKNEKYLVNIKELLFLGDGNYLHSY